VELNPDYREAIEAVFFDGLSVKELARLLKISHSAADKKLHRAVKALEKSVLSKKVG